MSRFFVLIFLLLSFSGHRVFSFEIETTNDDYNIVFVKNKQYVNGGKKKTNNTNNTLNKAKTNGNKSIKPAGSNAKMYASATGNISAEDADDLLRVLPDDHRSDFKQKNAQKSNSHAQTQVNKIKNANIKKVKKTKRLNTSKVVVSYSGDSVAIDNELCKMVARNDVVNVKKTLSMMKYDSKYVNWRCEHNTPLLLLAVEHNNLLVAKLLIEKGADVNLVDDAGVSPLHWIARNNNDGAMDMFAVIMSVDNLVVNVRDIEGYTPLMRAVEFENVDIVNALLGKQSDVYIKNNYGESAMKLARKRLEAKKNNDDKTNIERILKMLEVNV